MHRYAGVPTVGGRPNAEDARVLSVSGRCSEDSDARVPNILRIPISICVVQEAFKFSDATYLRKKRQAIRMTAYPARSARIERMQVGRCGCIFTYDYDKKPFDDCLHSL